MDPPEIEGAGHLVGYLFQVGPSTAGEVVTFQEIQSWAVQTGHVLNAWEVETLRRLSAAYLAEFSDAADEHRPPPSRSVDQPINHDDIAAKLAGILDQFERQDASMGLGEKAAR